MSIWIAVAEVVRSSAAALILFFSLCVFWAGVKIVRCNSSEYKRNAVRASSILSVFMGDVKTRRDGLRDDKVAAGLALRTGRWVEQGRFSDEALHDALER